MFSRTPIVEDGGGDHMIGVSDRSTIEATSTEDLRERVRKAGGYTSAIFAATRSPR
jgi:hypothetical protein